MSQETLTYEKFLQAPPSLVFQAFTNASALREWMCDGATVAPQPGGRFYAWWNAGYFASGEFIDVEAPKRAAVTWQGRGQVPDTRVQVLLEATDGGARLTLAHTIEGSGQDYEQTIKDFKAEWPRSLENLASVLETGQDLRFVKRPMLGIFLNDFNAEIAARQGVPVSEGVRLQSVIEGMGAEAAGLRSDDVIISMGGRPVTDFPSLTVALQGHQAGDTVEVVFYRGPELKTVQMKLSGRSLPEIPATAAEMAERTWAISQNDLTELEAFLQGVSEEEASYKPAAEEWSVKEILAHLIHSERGLQAAIVEMYAGFERIADDFPGNIYAQVAATVSAYPSLSDLHQELERSLKESAALIKAAPTEFVARKGSFTRLGYNCLDTTGSHLNTHLEQIQAVVEEARQVRS